MNRWHVFEYMKSYFNRYGRIPSRNLLEFEFRGIEKEELEEGIAEFMSVHERLGQHENRIFSA